MKLKGNMLRRLLVVLVLALGGCEGERRQIPLSPDLEAMEADNVVYGLEHVMTREGVREAIVRADTAFFFRDSTIVILRGNVHLTSFDPEQGNEIADVTAERGRLNSSNNALVARGNAVLEIRAEGRRIESTELHYAPGQDRIWSDSASVMYVEDRIIRGSGFDSDLAFRRPTIRNARTEPRNGRR
jgi:LPS export ABC transporter protein LptC